MKHDTTVGFRQCAACCEADRRRIEALADYDAVGMRVETARALYRKAASAGEACPGTRAWTAWHDAIDMLENDLAYSEVQMEIATKTYIACIDEHTAAADAAKQTAGDAAEASEAPAETEEMPMTAQEAETDAAGERRMDALDLHVARWRRHMDEYFADHADEARTGCDADDGDDWPYRCGSFLNALSERHAPAERHENEEHDVLRNAVRALEHGDAAPLREFSIGSRQGRRETLRELRELLDDMIADLDDDTEEGAQ